ncbi:TPA: hypothetical protein R5442_000210, partial [Campylobacter jejuni]|nr:hypothetical protein [Campylobacter jejuni]HEF3925413.1 hypothetical protein [Campylobacter jejuni]HEG3926200.1 hypothetical protein [Campylobacter jejuni]HEG5338878.1 hypothetical protein [Campylobacter jejuni]HEG6058250.1 hypothetical protein [Campylobacter jejuni]
RIDDALQNTLSFQKGYHNAAKDKGKGAEHIKMHLKEDEEGFITQSELLNLGKSVREYLAEFKEPFIDKNGARIYEWFDENGVKFRLVVDNPKGSGTSSPSLPLSDDDIITYFSDRFSDKGIKFYNSKVDSAYESFFSNKVETARKELDKLDNAFSQLHNAPFYKDIDIYEISYKMPLRYLYDKAKSRNSIAKEILENFSTGFEGRGYSGYSMSNNAVAAYENGHKPISKFTKEDADELSDLFAEKWSVKEIKDLVKNYGEVGYHHTSKFYNTTNFYSIAQAFRNIAEYEEDYLKKLIKNIPAPEQSKKDIDDFLSYVKKQDELREQLDKEIYQKRKEFFEIESPLVRHKYIKQRDEQLKIEKERELKRAAYLKAFEAKKPLAQNFMEYLEKIGWYQNPEKHALNKERYLNDELEKAFQIYEWLNDKTYLKSLDELKAAGFSGTQRYHLGRLKHFEKDLKAYFDDERG